MKVLKYVWDWIARESGMDKPMDNQWINKPMDNSTGSWWNDKLKQHNFMHLQLAQ